MPRLDIYPMLKTGMGYVVDVQAELLATLSTRAVVPLLPESVAPKPIGELNPVFDIQGDRYVMVAQSIASVPLRELGRAVGTLAEHNDRVTRALDILLVGF